MLVQILILVWCFIVRSTFYTFSFRKFQFIFYQPPFAFTFHQPVNTPDFLHSVTWMQNRCAHASGVRVGTLAVLCRTGRSVEGGALPQEVPIRTLDKTAAVALRGAEKGLGSGNNQLYLQRPTPRQCVLSTDIHNSICITPLSQSKYGTRRIRHFYCTTIPRGQSFVMSQFPYFLLIN